MTLISPDKKDVTIVIETMVSRWSLDCESDLNCTCFFCQSHDHSVCIRPRLSPYTVTNQSVTFQLKGSLVYTLPDSLLEFSTVYCVYITYT